jgi:hypothetical protein
MQKIFTFVKNNAEIVNIRKWRDSAHEVLCDHWECGEYYVTFKVTLYLVFFVALGT